MWKKIIAFLVCSASCNTQAYYPQKISSKQQPTVPGQVMVAYNPGFSAEAQAVLLERLGAVRLKRFSLSGMELVQAPSFSALDQWLAVLRQQPGVRIAEPNFRRWRNATTPNDPLFTDQWYLKNTGQADFRSGIAGLTGADIRIADVWDSNADGVADRTGVTQTIVAIIDDGVQRDHPDLASVVGVGYDFGQNDTDPSPVSSDDVHGTYVAGLIGAVGNNNAGMAGVGWNLTLMPIRFSFDSASFIESMAYARTHGAQIINASFGGSGYSQLELEEIRKLEAAGILLVAAAGNDDANLDRAVLAYPANYDSENIIAVAASNRNDQLSGFSQFGPISVDVAAPGEQIRTTQIGSAYTARPGVSGTSFATPLVTGAAALLRSHVSPTPSVAALRARVIEAANRNAALTKHVGSGRLDAASAFQVGESPSLILRSVSVTGGDGNGVLDPGETATLRIEVKNIWLAAPAGSAVLSSNSGSVTVNTATASLPALTPQENATIEFSVTAANAASSRAEVSFAVRFTAGAYQTERSFQLEVSSLEDGLVSNASFSGDQTDEFHAWHFNITSLPPGADRLTISTAANQDVDLLAKLGATPQYHITVGINPEVDIGSFCTSGVTANCLDPDTIIGGRPDGNEIITFPNPAAGTYHFVVVNFAQAAQNYRLMARAEGPPGQLRFKSASLTAPEKDGTRELVVERIGGSFGTVSANVSVLGGSATAGSDYQYLTTPVRFAAGDTEAKMVTVSITDDTTAEGAETIQFGLTELTGGAGIAEPAVATVTITDDETPSNEGGKGGGGGGSLNLVSLLLLFFIFSARKSIFLRRLRTNSSGCFLLSGTGKALGALSY